jgi:peptidyl-prolyl cis-trans isomerase A (cyclophilin A)
MSLFILIAGCASPHPGLQEPGLANDRAPDDFRVRFETTRGPFIVAVTREWAPLAADRFYNLVQLGYFEDAGFFRVIPGFVAQFGISGDPKISARWKDATIPDDPVRAQNLRGYLSFAMSGPHSRTTQLFINLANNVRLDRVGFAPFGRVVEGIEVVDLLYAGYGEGSPRGRGPAQDLIYSEGNRYLREEFPRLDFVVTATMQEPSGE